MYLCKSSMLAVLPDTLSRHTRVLPVFSCSTAAALCFAVSPGVAEVHLLPAQSGRLRDHHDELQPRDGVY